MKNEYLISLPETDEKSIDAYRLVWHILKTQNLDPTKPFRMALLNVPFFEAQTAEPNSMYLMINCDGFEVAPTTLRAFIDVAAIWRFL